MVNPSLFVMRSQVYKYPLHVLSESRCNFLSDNSHKKETSMTLTQDILDQANKGSAGLGEPERLALLQASEKLTVALEQPLEKFIRLFFVRVHVLRNPKASYKADDTRPSMTQ